MILTDKNETLKPPAGYNFYQASACGAYLVLTYMRTTLWTATKNAKDTSIITIYLNDQGREVIRTESAVHYDRPMPPQLSPPHTSRWKLFCLWFNREL